MPESRRLQELPAVDDSAWPTVEAWIQAASNPVEFLAPDETERNQALLEQSTGVVNDRAHRAAESDLRIVDHGWLRFLGPGSAELSRSMPAWNRGRTTDTNRRSRGLWLVADDVAGGFSALKEGKDISKCSRKPCRVEEIFSFHVVDFPQQLPSGSET